MIEHGGAAFASGSSSGMSLRDWFAGNAITSMYGPAWAMTPEQVAEWAYRLADAMVAESNKSPDGK